MMKGRDRYKTKDRERHRGLRAKESTQRQRKDVERERRQESETRECQEGNTKRRGTKKGTKEERARDDDKRTINEV
jgi:hypothetical protein